jgi:hypothetical protein
MKARGSKATRGHERLRPFSCSEPELLRKPLPETVWKVGGGFLIACVSCVKRARWDIFALFWLLAILQIEAYWDFPDSLSTHSGE